MSALKQLTALKLRAMLVASLFLILAIIVGIFYIGRQQLSVIAVSVNHANADAAASDNNLSTLQKLQETLKTNQSVIDRATKLDATSTGYDYQNQILDDLANYGRQTGVTFTGADFSVATATPATTSVAPATAPGATTSPVGGSTPAATVAPVKTITVTVTLDSPVSYTSLLNFIHAIEQNLPKMQISRLNISRYDKDPTKVNVTSFGIEMYTK